MPRGVEHREQDVGEQELDEVIALTEVAGGNGEQEGDGGEGKGGGFPRSRVGLRSGRAPGAAQEAAGEGDDSYRKEQDKSLGDRCGRKVEEGCQAGGNGRQQNESRVSWSQRQ